MAASPEQDRKALLEPFSGAGALEEGLGVLLSPRSHDVALRTQRAALVLARSTWIAALFAAVTPAWIVFDALNFEPPLWRTLAAGRLAAGGLFALLAWYARRSRGGRATPPRALAVLLALFAIPIAFFVFSHDTIHRFGTSIDVISTHAAYVDLPFIIAAGISIFPLTVAENAAIVLPLLAAVVWAAGGDPGYFIAHGLGVTAVALTASLASLIQLGFMAVYVERSARDGLTSLFTRRFGEQLLALQSEIARRAGAPFSLVFIDLDGFKEINDRYGHEAGDGVLRAAAQAIGKAVRRQDIAVRWGGEEILLALPNTDEQGADALLRRLAAIGLGTRPDGRPQTASVGIAECRRDGVADWRRLAQIGDARMYLAKQAGRNRVVGCDGAARVFIAEA